MQVQQFIRALIMREYYGSKYTTLVVW